MSDEHCVTPAGRQASDAHSARLDRAAGELVLTGEVWAELVRRGATLAAVPFAGRPGRSATFAAVTLQVEDGELVELQHDGHSGDRLIFALQAPVPDRFGSFAGFGQVRGSVVWNVPERLVKVGGVRARGRFEETLT